MKSLLQAVGLVIVLLCSMVPGPTLAQSAPFVTCNSSTWSETRPSLGGYYFLDGWSVGFINLFQLTAISGTLYGNFTSITFLADGSYEQMVRSVSGAYDDTQISIAIDGFAETRVLTGTWVRDGITVSAPSPEGKIDTFFLAPMSVEAAQQVVNLWPQHAIRQSIYNSLVPTMVKATAGSDWQASAIQRIYGDVAASYLGIKSMSAVDLLINGWLASAQFSDKEPNSLPNQVNWYTAHAFSTPAQAIDAAGCWIQLQKVDAEKFRQVDSLDGTAIYLYEQQAEYGTIVYVLAVHGSTLITASLTGGEAVIEHGKQMVLGIIRGSR